MNVELMGHGIPSNDSGPLTVFWCNEPAGTAIQFDADAGTTSRGFEGVVG
jgi:hypothetical protein